MLEFVIATTSPALLATSCLLLLLAGASDVATRRVPNWLSLCLVAIGVALHLQWHDLLAGLLSAMAVFVLGAVCWRRGWLGGGDVKLLAAAALLVAPYRVPSLMLAVSLAGGLLALAYLLLRATLPGSAAPVAAESKTRHRAGPLPLLSRIIRIEHWRIRRGAPLPYASAIFAGVIFMLLSN